MSTGTNLAGAAGLPPLFSPAAHPQPAAPDPSAPGGGHGPASEFQRRFDEALASGPALGTQAGPGQPPAPEHAGRSGAGETRRAMQLQDGRLLTPAREASAGTRPEGLFSAETESLRSLPSRWESFRERVHTRLSSGEDISNQELILMQLEMNEISFQVETASKVVEHATSGTKTVLQTQA